MTTTPLICTIALSLTLLVGACGSGSSDGSAAAAPKPTPEVASQPDGGVTKVPELAGQRGIYKDVTIRSCEVGPGPVKANGTVKNSAKKTLDVVLTVRWVNPKGNGVIDADTAVLRRLPPGKSAHWSAKGTADSKKKSVCSFSVVAGTAN